MSEYSGTRPTLTIKRTHVTSQGYHHALGFKSLSLRGCRIANADVVFDSSILAFLNQSTGAEFTGPLLEIQPTPDYGLEIAGILIDESNKNRITQALGLTEGSVTFSPASNTLTLTDAVIKVTDNVPGIVYDGDGELTLSFSGNSQVRCTASGNSKPGIITYSPLAITGDGWFEVDANGIALESVGADVTFRNAVNTGFFGSRGLFATGDPALSLYHSGVYANGDNTDFGAISGFKGVSMKYCMVVEPEEDIPYDWFFRSFMDSEDYRPCLEINIMPTGMPGDVNGDGDVDITDVVAIANHVMGDTPPGFVLDNADMNADGDVDITDVVAMANSVMGV